MRTGAAGWAGSTSPGPTCSRATARTLRLEALDAAQQVFTGLGLAWHVAETETARATLLGGSADAAAAAYRALGAPDRWVDRAFHGASTALPHPPATVVP